jgi:Cys-tRNA(Pro) deacylase
MTDATARVRRFFAARGVQVAIQTFDASVHTAQQAAQALGTEVRTIVKSLVFEADGQPVLVLCSGDRRVDTAKLAALCAAQQVRQATAERTKSVTGYSIGGVPPVAHATALPIFMDQALLTCEVVYAAAGTARTLFAITPQDLRDVSGARIVTVSAGG